MLVDREISLDLRRPLFALVVLLLLLSPPPGVAQQTDPAPAAGATRQGQIFTDEVKVNVVNLYVTVVDRDGRPVSGLTADDLEIVENGEQMEITNFTEVGLTPTSVESMPGDRTQPAPTALPPQVVLVFDNTSLERERRGWVIDTVRGWLDTTAVPDARLMVVSMDPDLEIVQTFTSNRASLEAALDRITEKPAQGDAAKSQKRNLKRDIQSIRTVGTPQQRAPATVVGDQAGRSVLGQIDTLRYREYARVDDSLGAIDRLVRGLSGLPGRKDILWFGEDLLMRPALDEYRVYFTKFNAWSMDLNLDEPNLWATRLDLRHEFRYVGGVAQTASVVVHVIDASDRDRELASSEYGAADVWTQVNVNPRGPSATGGYSLLRFDDMTDGGRYLAGTTGGTFFGASRVLDVHLDVLSELIGNYYSIGYARPGSPDDGLHSVTVKVADGDLRVRTHERVPNPTPDQRLVDTAISRLLIDEGPNALGMAVILGDRDPAEGDRYIQDVVLAIPAGSLYLTEQSGELVGRIAVAVVAADARGDVAPPRVLRMGVSVPTAEMRETLVATAELQFEMDEGSVAVAVAVRDENSGATASVLTSVDE